MDINLENYGWTGDIDCVIDMGTLVFNEEGLIVNDSTLANKDNKLTISATFSTDEFDKGLVLWYNSMIDMILFSIDNNYLEVRRIYKGNESILERVSFEKKGIDPSLDTSQELRAELNKDTISCYYNDTLVLDVEDRAFTEGSFGIYGSQNVVCSEFNMSTSPVQGWTINKSSESSVRKLEDLVYLTIPQEAIDKDANISQTLEIAEAGDYTLSLSLQGEVYLEFIQEGVTIDSVTFSSQEEGRYSHSLTIGTLEPLTIKIGANLPGTHSIKEVQFEKKSFSTSYTEVSREKSQLTFPIKNETFNRGSLAFWIKTLNSYETKSLPLFYYSDTFKLDYTAGVATLTIGSQTLDVTTIIEPGKDYYLVASWDNNEDIWVGIVDHSASIITYETLELDGADLGYSDFIYIGCNETEVGNMYIDELLIFRDKLDIERIATYRDVYGHFEDIVLTRCSFDNEEFLYSDSKFSIPIGRADSPILVSQTNDLGEVNYDRVYFTRNGEYSLYYTQVESYSGSEDISLDYDDILDIKVLNFDTKESIPYTLIESNVRLENPEDHQDVDLEIVYKVKNTFIVTYNSKLKQYFIELSNPQDGDIEVVFEDSEANTERLIKSVELNPFKASNNNGFIYIEDEARKLETFDIKVSPDSIVANGYDIATITIDCLSKGGIPTSNVDLEVSIQSQISSIYKYESSDEKEYREYSEEFGEEAAIEKYGTFSSYSNKTGRFVYKYKAPGSIDSPYMIDKINIRDKESKIGVQIPIRIVKE